MTSTSGRALVATLAITGMIFAGAISPAAAAPVPPTETPTATPEPTVTATPTPTEEPSPVPTNVTQAPGFGAREFSALAAGTRTISGAVYKDGISLKFGAGEVTVQLRAASSPYATLATSNTDANGNYTFTDLAPASYQVYFQYNGSAGYYSRWAGDKYGYGSEPVNETTVSTLYSDLSLDQTLERANDLTGTVRLGIPTASTALAGQDQVAALVRYAVSNNTWSPWSAPVFTNASGQYTFANLRPDLYELKFSYVGSDAAYQTDWAWPGGYFSYQSFLVKKFNSAAIVNDATIAPTGVISGTVSLGSVSRLAGAGEVTITAERYTGSGFPYEPTGITVSTDAVGHFTFPSNTGSYRLVYTYSGSSDYKRVSAGGTAQIDPIRGVSSASVDYTVANAYSVSGHLSIISAFTGTRSATIGEVEVSLLPVVSGNPVPPAVRTDAAGNYTFTDVPPATYTVRFENLDVDASTYYQVEYLRSLGLLRQITVNANQPGIDLTMGLVGASFSGTVRDAVGAPVSGVDVYVTTFVPVTGTYLERTVATSALGRYEFHGLSDTLSSVIDFEAAGYAYTRLRGTSYYYDGGVLQPSVGQRLTGLDVTLYRPGSIAGTVSVSGADLATSGSAWLEVAVFDYATRKWVRTGDTYAAASNGSYRIDGLYPDLYRIWAFYRDSSTGRAGSTMSGTFDVAEGGSITFSPQITVGTNADEARAASKAFVSAAYEDVLGRVPSTRESNYWVDTLANGASRAVVASGFNNSDEYRSIKIRAAYRDVLGRDGEDRGVQYWLSLMRAGLIQPDDVHRTFLSSDEFYNRQGGGTPAGYVAALYRDQIGREPDVRGAAYWAGVLASQGRGAVVDGLWYSTETYQKRVSDAYALLLGRAPEGRGLDFWVGVARTNGLTEMRTRIMSSAEYFAIAQLRF